MLNIRVFFLVCYLLFEKVSLITGSKYQGFCIDLLEKISKMCGFNYTIKLVDDGFHGSYVDGKWNGLVSELIDKVNTTRFFFSDQSVYQLIIHVIL
jgi:hypothetical protein